MKLTTLRDLVTDCQENQAVNPWEAGYDIVCNGFNMKAVIIDVLREHLAHVDNEHNEKIAEAIKEAFAVKMGLKQG